MRKTTGFAFAVSFVLALAAGPSSAQAPFSDFDDGTLQGWSKWGTFNGTLTNPGTGGNPDGFLLTIDTMTGGGTLRVLAPDEFEGDLSIWAGIRWDEHVYSCTGPQRPTFPAIQGVDGTRYEEKDWFLRATDQWIAREVPFEEQYWELIPTTGSASFQEVLQNVDELQINVECNQDCLNGESAGLDNVHYYGCIDDYDCDGVPDFEDNCPEEPNPNQYDCDEDGLGDACDPDAQDTDLDGLDDACDNCPDVRNVAQADTDDDGEGDLCDLNDGLLFFTEMTPPQQSWQDEWQVYTTYHLYRGDLDVLRATGVYTQDPGTVPDAAKVCDLGPTPFYFDMLDPAPGQAFFYLVTGSPAPCGESPLGHDSSGGVRPFDERCGGGVQDFAISLNGPLKNMISLPREIISPVIHDAADLWQALEDQGLGPQLVTKWSPCPEAWIDYPPDNFEIDPWDGLAYWVQVDSWPSQLVLTGVDCTSTVQLYGTVPLCEGWNGISLPFSTPLHTAEDLLEDVPNAFGVAKWDPFSNSSAIYPGFQNFLIHPGEGYFVQVQFDTTYTPSLGETLTAWTASATVYLAGLVGSGPLASCLVGVVVCLMLARFTRRDGGA